MASKPFTQHDVFRLFTYDKKRACLIWKFRKELDFKDGKKNNARCICALWNVRYGGKVAGYIDRQGYRSININGSMFKAHRLIWLYHHGEIPDMLDHVNGTRSGNRIENLREADFVENSRNQRLPKNNTSGFIGVYAYHGRWRAHIRVEENLIHLGSFLTKEEAISARLAANEKYGFHENHGMVRAGYPGSSRRISCSTRS